MDHDDSGSRHDPGRSHMANPDRRAFMGTVVLSGIAALVAGIPLAAYTIHPAFNKGTGKWIDFGPVERLTPGSVSMLSYEFMAKDGWLVLPQRGFVWARMEADRRLTVFSSTCTHLACSVVWRESERVFECPCHAGIYDAEGRPISGPPPTPLVVLNHKVENGKLMVMMNV
jgi:Rieske Fe-S protein